MMTEKFILLTGATGYIGSHTWIELLISGYKVIGIDDFSNSSPIVLERIKKIISQKINFFQGSVGDKKFLHQVFEKFDVGSVIHFAGLKAVGDSAKEPLSYYEQNIAGMLNLLTVMKTFDVKTFIFSSSATVYDSKNPVPYSEEMPLSCVSPYGWTKYMGEQILSDLESSDKAWRIAKLRYFNPIGAHQSGEIGENPRDVPNNLMPYISQVAIGLREQLSIYGADYPTFDGTCIRDYIHVVDLAKGHIAALNYLESEGKSIVVNLGTGKGTSVFELLHTFETVANVKVPYQVVSRRPGDVVASYADVSKAQKFLNWSAGYDLSDMCSDVWRWQVKNPGRCAQITDK
jgi:UDP-glucose 4-epimerase